MINRTQVLKHKWIIAFIAIQFADVLTTAVGIWIMGFTEMNPLISFMPLWILMIAKMVIVAGMALVLYYVELPLWATKLLVGITAVTVVWNLFNIVFEIVYPII